VRTSRVTFVVLIGLFLVAACSTTGSATASPRPVVSLSPPTTSATGTPVTTTSDTPAPTLPVLPSVEPSPTAVPTAGQPTSATGISGSWTGTWQSTKTESSSGNFQATFNQSGDTFTGTIEVSARCVSHGTLTGSLSGDNITFGAVNGAETVAFDGTISGNTMSGNYTTGSACGHDKGTWTASRD
jgi:hypothetical protein